MLFALVLSILGSGARFCKRIFKAACGILVVPMNHPSSRRRQLFIRTAVYTLMTVSVVVVVTVLMLIVLGYSFNRQAGTIEQGGLLQFASSPSGATVTLNSQRLSSRTPSKSYVEASSHHVQMELAGYRPWQKTVSVGAGSIAWLNYARLIPEKITTTPLVAFPELTASMATENGEWMLLQGAASSPEFTLMDLRQAEPKQSQLALPETLYTIPDDEGVPQEFTLMRWSENGRQALIRYTYGAPEEQKREWLVVDRADVSRSVNVTTSFAVDMQEVLFGDSDGRHLYVHVANEDNVRSIDLDDQTISRPIAANIAQFSVFDERTVLFSTKPDDAGARSLGYVTEDMKAAQVVRSFAAEGTAPYMAFGEYYGNRYVAIVADGVLEVLKGNPPSASSEGTLRSIFSRTIAPGAQSVEFSESGRFAVVQRADGFTTYDIEQQKFDETQLKNATASTRPLTWLDRYMLWSDRGGMLRFYEFDGANQNDIVPVVEGHAVALRDGGKLLYTIGMGEDGVALQRSQLTVR